MTPPPAERRALAAYRRLLRLYPAEFRREFGRELDLAFLDRWRAEKSPRRRVRLWCDLLKAALVEAPGAWASTRPRLRDSEVSAPGAALAGIVADSRYAWRLLRRSPASSLVTVVTLALAIGAGTSVFAVANAIYFKSLPLVRPDRLVRLYAQGPSGHFGAGFSTGEFKSVRDHTTAAVSVAAETLIAQLHVIAPSGVQEARGAFVTPDYFSLLGVGARRGRLFGSAADEAVAVVSDRVWRDLLGPNEVPGDAAINVNGLRLTVIGVAPPGFVGDDIARGTDIWLPATLIDAAGYGCPRGQDCPVFDVLIARLRDRVSLAGVQAEAAANLGWPAGIGRDPAGRRRLVAQPMTGAPPDMQAALRSQMLLLAVISGLLLAVVCANLAGLGLARGATRRQELAVRLSIGASRWRVVRQLMTETVSLAALAGGASVVAAAIGARLLSSYYRVDSEGFAYAYDFGIDGRVFMCAGLLAVAAAALIGSIPAWRLVRTSTAADLRRARVAGSAGDQRIRSGLLAAQIALSLVLLVASGLLAVSARTLLDGTHFQPDGVAVLRLRPELSRAAPARAEALARGVISRLRGLPGVESAGMMIGGEGLVWHWSSGRTRSVARSDGSALMTVPSQDIDSGLLDALRVPLRQGRAFTDADAIGSRPVAIVNETLGDILWPGGAAVGRVVMVDGQPREVVGVCATLQPPGGSVPQAPHLYLPFWQTAPAAKGDVRFAVRVSGSASTALPAVRAAIRELDPSVPIGEDMTLQDQVALEYGPVVLTGRVLQFCGVFSLGLTVIGVYSAWTFAVRSRTREIGVRMALGASPGAILREVLSSSVGVAMGGVIAGGVVTWLATRFLAAWLYGVNEHDPIAFVGGAVLVVAATVLAGYWPSRQASRIDPIAALRQE